MVRALLRDIITDMLRSYGRAHRILCKSMRRRSHKRFKLKYSIFLEIKLYFIILFYIAQSVKVVDIFVPYGLINDRYRKAVPKGGNG
jgi:hypothetical protein